MSQIPIIARNHAGVNIDDCFYIIFPPLTRGTRPGSIPHLLLPPGDITPYVMAKKMPTQTTIGCCTLSRVLRIMIKINAGTGRTAIDGA